MSNQQITLECMNGFSMRIQGGNLIISSKRTEEAFPISQIQSFSLKAPKGLSAGSITFRTAQAATAGINLGFGISAALGAEHNYFFYKADYETAQCIRDYVLNYQANPVPAPASIDNERMVVSVVEEIRGLKSLLDEGILTQEEFEAKKRQLLGI